jgi:hypothetical protein
MVQSLSQLGLFQLGTVTMRELLKLCRVVAVPLAQLRGRGHILTPLVECYLFQRGVRGRTTRERIVSPRNQTVELDASAAAATPTGLPL